MSRLTRRIPDEALVLRVRRGDQRAVRTLFDRHGGAAYSLAHAICGEQAGAELAVRDALLELWREGCFGEAALADLKTWLLRATRAAAIRAMRGRNGGSQQATAGVGARPALRRRAPAPHIQRALARLPDATRRAIELAYFDGADERAIAADPRACSRHPAAAVERGSARAVGRARNSPIDRD